MPAELELVHHHPGRLRVRSEALSGAPGEALWARIQQELSGFSGVLGVRHNALSGSVVVEYTPGAIEPDELIDGIGAAAGLALALPASELVARGAKPALGTIRATREINAFVAALTGQRLDLRSLVPVSMLGVAVYSFAVAKQRLPRWDNLTYWAVSLFQTWHAEEIERARSSELPHL